MIFEFSASVLAANPLTVADDILQVTRHGIKSLHLDIMDNHYVDNLALSFDTATAIINRFPHLNHDVHLMIEHPESALDRLPLDAIRMITFHPVTTENPIAFIEKIKKYCIASVAINPDENIHDFTDVLNAANHCLIMGVTPGRCGQAFQPSALTNINALYTMNRENTCPIQIAIDGGVNKTTLPSILNTKVPIAQAVMGSALFGIKNETQQLKDLMRTMA